MKLIESTIGRCLTRIRREDFKEVQDKYNKFFHVSQWDTRYTSKTSSILKDAGDTVINKDSSIYMASKTYGLSDDGITLEFIGQIIDSSD